MCDVTVLRNINRHIGFYAFGAVAVEEKAPFIIIAGHGSCKIKPLGIIASDRRKKLGLLHIFNALDYSTYRNSLCHADNR